MRIYLSNRTLRSLLKPAEPRIGKNVPRAIGRPARWIYFSVRLHGDVASAGPAATVAQVANEFFACVELRARWLVAIKIAYETNAEGDVVQIIAVHVAAVDLTPPTIAHFDLAVAGRSAVADHEVVGKTVLHPADMPMIIIKNARVPLPRSAVVHHNELPAVPFHGCAADSFDD